MTYAISAGTRRLRAAGTATALAMLATLAPSATRAADGPIADPKTWCSDAAKMILDKETEKFIDSFVFASGHLIDRPRAAQAFAALAPALAREGEALSQSFLLEKDYADAFSRVWFVVHFDNGILFLRCEGARRGKGWIITSVTVNDKSNDANLP